MTNNQRTGRFLPGFVLSLLGLILTAMMFASCLPQVEPPPLNLEPTTATEETTVPPPQKVITLPDSSTPASPIPSKPFTIQTPDGYLFFDIPVGALPPGTDPSSIQFIKAADNDPALPTVNDLPPLGFYRLDTGDIQLLLPADFRIAVPAAGNDIPSLWWLPSTSPKTPDAPLGSTTSVSGGKTVIEGKTNTLSNLCISRGGPFEVSLSNPGEQTVGDSFDVTATIVQNTKPMYIRYQDSYGAYQTDTQYFGGWEYTYEIKETSAPSHVSPNDYSSVIQRIVDSGQPVDPFIFSFKAEQPADQVQLTFETDIECNSSITYNTNSSVTTTCKYKIKAVSEFPIKDVTASGAYGFGTSVATDPSGHAAFIGLGTNIDIQVTQEADGSFTVSGTNKWVTVKGPILADGSFVLTGKGTVAGYPNVGVEFKGIWTADGGFSGTYTMGTGGELPGGHSITYNVTSIRK
jgi:hypothetical protein